jgi:hypothetical protein
MYQTPGEALLAQAEAHIAAAEEAWRRTPRRRWLLCIAVFVAWMLVPTADLALWFRLAGACCVGAPLGVYTAIVWHRIVGGRGALDAFDRTKQEIQLYVASLQAERDFSLPSKEK